MVESSNAKGTTSQPGKAVQEDEALKQFNEAIEKAEAALATSSPNAPDRFKKLDDLACTLADKACYVKINRLGMLLEALEYAKQALESVPENHVREDEVDAERPARTFQNKGVIGNTMRGIYTDLYWETKESKYLDEAIRSGLQSVEFMTKHRAQYLPVLYQTLYSQRATYLASLYKIRFDDSDPAVGGVEDDLDSAIDMQSIGTDEAIPGMDAYRRFCEWCDLMVVKSGLRNDLQYIDNAISARSRQPKPEGDRDSDEYACAAHNDSEYVTLLCRRWHVTDAQEDFQKILDEARPMTKREIERENPPPYVSNSDNEKDILRVCGRSLSGDLQEGTKWEKHIPTLETAIALYTKLINSIPLDTKEAIEERDVPLMELNRLVQTRWAITKNPKHGFDLDMINVHSAQQAVLMNIIEEEKGSFILEGMKHASYGISAGSGKEFSTFDHPSVPLRQQRLCFVGGIAPENWIRKRNDDGTLELGATQDDVDVLEFCKNASKSQTSKMEEGGDTEPRKSPSELVKVARDHRERGFEGKNEDSESVDQSSGV